MKTMQAKYETGRVTSKHLETQSPSLCFMLSYCPQITSWSPQGMRVLRQCNVPRAEVMFITIQRENIHPSKKEMNNAVTMLKSPDVCS
jgi:hypothetical protein